MANRLPHRVCFPFVGDRIGGSHLSTLTLIEALDRSRFEPVIVLHEDGPLGDDLRTRGLHYELLPLSDYVGRGIGIAAHARSILLSLPPLRRFLRHQGVSLLHSNDMRMNQTWALPARLAGVPQIWHQRALFTDSRLSGWLVGLARQVVAISCFIAEGLPARARARSTTLVNPFAAPPALDRETCRRDLCKELGLPGETRLVGLFCNLIDWKRPLHFVDVAGAVGRSGVPQVAFLAFGDDRHGLGKTMQDRAVAAGVGDRLFLPGFRSPVWPLMAACDVVLATAENEPFGRTLVEAMLVGTPVVATASGGHLEIIDGPDTGVLVPLGDVEAMAAATVAWLTDRAAAAAHAARAQRLALERFDQHGHANAMQALYRAALGAAAA